MKKITAIVFEPKEKIPLELVYTSDVIFRFTKERKIKIVKARWEIVNANNNN
ncbi:hypothetical protein LCGC14_2725610 [marine sediment metagenome]|uniref:Uncharacterized protein n=1 Tax=marine sediment metagenome TaxID=412755 RepID=A0A0F8Z8R7_9ZZZZ